MGMVWLSIVPYVNGVITLYWFFVWLPAMCKDLEHHTGLPFNDHYSKIRLGFILYLVGIFLTFIVIGIVPVIIGAVFMIQGVIAIAKDLQRHMQEEGKFDPWMTKGVIGIGAALIWPLQLILNNHWIDHGYIK